MSNLQVEDVALRFPFAFGTLTSVWIHRRDVSSINARMGVLFDFHLDLQSVNCPWPSVSRRAAFTWHSLPAINDLSSLHLELGFDGFVGCFERKSATKAGVLKDWTKCRLEVSVFFYSLFAFGFKNSLPRKVIYFSKCHSTFQTVKQTRRFYGTHRLQYLLIT